MATRVQQFADAFNTGLCAHFFGNAKDASFVEVLFTAYGTHMTKAAYGVATQQQWRALELEKALHAADMMSVMIGMRFPSGEGKHSVSEHQLRAAMHNTTASMMHHLETMLSESTVDHCSDCLNTKSLRRFISDWPVNATAADVDMLEQAWRDYIAHLVRSDLSDMALLTDDTYIDLKTSVVAAARTLGAHLGRLPSALPLEAPFTVVVPNSHASKWRPRTDTWDYTPYGPARKEQLRQEERMYQMHEHPTLDWQRDAAPYRGYDNVTIAPQDSFAKVGASHARLTMAAALHSVQPTVPQEQARNFGRLLFEMTARRIWYTTDSADKQTRETLAKRLNTLDKLMVDHTTFVLQLTEEKLDNRVIAPNTAQLLDETNRKIVNALDWLTKRTMPDALSNAWNQHIVTYNAFVEQLSTWNNNKVQQRDALSLKKAESKKLSAAAEEAGAAVGRLLDDYFSKVSDKTLSRDPPPLSHQEALLGRREFLLRQEDKRILIDAPLLPVEASVPQLKRLLQVTSNEWDIGLLSLARSKLTPGHTVVILPDSYWQGRFTGDSSSFSKFKSQVTSRTSDALRFLVGRVLRTREASVNDLAEAFGVRRIAGTTTLGFVQDAQISDGRPILAVFDESANAAQAFSVTRSAAENQTYPIIWLATPVDRAPTTDRLRQLLLNRPKRIKQFKEAIWPGRGGGRPATVPTLGADPIRQFTIAESILVASGLKDRATGRLVANSPGYIALFPSDFYAMQRPDDADKTGWVDVKQPNNHRLTPEQLQILSTNKVAAAAFMRAHVLPFKSSNGASPVAKAIVEGGYALDATGLTSDQVRSLIEKEYGNFSTLPAVVNGIDSDVFFLYRKIGAVFDLNQVVILASDRFSVVPLTQLDVRTQRDRPVIHLLAGWLVPPASAIDYAAQQVKSKRRSVFGVLRTGDPVGMPDRDQSSYSAGLETLRRMPVFGPGMTTFILPDTVVSQHREFQQLIYANPAYWQSFSVSGRLTVVELLDQRGMQRRPTLVPGFEISVSRIDSGDIVVTRWNTRNGTKTLYRLASWESLFTSEHLLPRVYPIEPVEGATDVLVQEQMDVALAVGCGANKSQELTSIDVPTRLGHVLVQNCGLLDECSAGSARFYTLFLPSDSVLIAMGRELDALSIDRDRLLTMLKAHVVFGPKRYCADTLRAMAANSESLTTADGRELLIFADGDALFVARNEDHTRYRLVYTMGEWDSQGWVHAVDHLI